MGMATIGMEMLTLLVKQGNLNFEIIRYWAMGNSLKNAKKCYGEQSEENIEQKHATVRP